MTYAEVLDYLYSCLPMFHRVGAAAYKADLDNTHRLMALLDHPERGFRSVHVAGTNGKGSSSHMLASILQSAGYKTGLYTSPHLLDFRERIRIDGVMIPESAVIAFVETHRAAFDAIQPSFFEWTVALAFDHFRKSQVDIAVIETGLGGRLDSTNVILPEVSLITNIGWDHMNLLGDTLEKIAVEKAGIIKAGVPVVVSETQDSVRVVFERQAGLQGAPLVFADQTLQLTHAGHEADLLRVHVHRNGEADGTLLVGLPGQYQLRNVAGVLATVQALTARGWTIPDEAIVQGLRTVRARTGLMGRWQQLHTNPRVIADVGHNADGIREILQQLHREKFAKLRWVIGVVQDKDLTRILPLLPTDARYYCCKPDLPRGRAADSLRDALREHSLDAGDYPSVAKALEAAMQEAGAEDLVLVAGSTFVVGEALGHLTP